METNDITSIPEIHKILVVSTAHITKNSDMVMRSLTGEDNEVVPGAFSDEVEYGFMISLSDLDEDDDPEAGALNGEDRKAMIAVRDFATKHDCRFVRIDRDGPVCAQLQTYNW